MYSGEEAARSMRLQAFENRVQGEFAQTGGVLQAEAAMSRGQSSQYSSYSSIANSVGGLYAKYGGQGFGGPGTGSGGINWDSGGVGDMNVNYA